MFCGSNSGHNDVYREKAVALGRLLAEQGVRLDGLLRRRRDVLGSAAVIGSVWLFAGRIATELVRGDVDRGQIGPLSTSQALASIGIVAVLLAWRRHRSQGKLGPTAKTTELPPS